MNSFNSMQYGINKRTRGSFTITGATQSTPIIYETYSICLFLGNGTITTPNSSTKIGYLVVGGGGTSGTAGSPGAPGGGVNYCPHALSIKFLSPSSTYSITVGNGLTAVSNNNPGTAGSSIISGTDVSVIAVGGGYNGAPVTTSLLQGGSYTSSAGGFFGTTNSNGGNGGDGLNLSTIFSDINMSGYIAGGGGGAAGTAGYTPGNGGLGGGSGGASRAPPISTGGLGVVQFGTSTSFGANGGSGTASTPSANGGTAGANTGGGAGSHIGTASSTSGSGVVIVYWKT
jgi:hypothetical protein